MADEEVPKDIDDHPIDERLSFLDQSRVVIPMPKKPDPKADIKAMSEIMSGLTLTRWNKLDIPPRDWAIEGFFSTTSRMMIVGQTGAGKTLFSLDLAAAIATGGRMLDWVVKRPMRVLYLDGEASAETMKERTEASLAVYGETDNLVILNRDVIPDDWMRPLNFDEGEAWLLKAIEAFRPEVIVYDSIAFLTLIDLKKAEEWTRVRELMNRITASKIGQILTHHTGYEGTRSYGDATKEWNQETVILLNKPEPGATAPGKVVMNFGKARNRTDKTAHLFRDLTIKRHDTGWGVEGEAQKDAKPATLNLRMQHFFLECLDRLADKAEASVGFKGEPVRKVRLPELLAEMIDRGHVNRGDKGQIPSTERSRFNRAKDALMNKSITEKGGLVWRIEARL